MPYGWGTGAQVTSACLMPDDCLKVIDQGADDTTNAVSIRRFFQRTAGVATTEATGEASIIQTRHRIPETPLSEGQTLSIRCPFRSRCVFWNRVKPRPARCMRLPNMA